MRKKLTTYREKRNLKKSGEPSGRTIQKRSNAIFVVQKHDASHLHYDFRLAIGGVLPSWAVPKGPPRRTGIKRLAIQTEDHPLEYATFEGTIPAGNYGAGTVEIWDSGTYENNSSRSMQQQLEDGIIDIKLHGTLLRGNYALVRKKDEPKQWFFFKKKNSN